MNSVLEIHDSALAGVERNGRDMVLRLAPGYLHRSEGRPGIDPGSGWLQDIDLVIRGAIIASLPSGLPCVLSDGALSVNGEDWDNAIPLPLEVSGAVSLSLTTSSGESLVVRGSGAEVVPRGEPRYIEPFPGVADP
jgi:hypothetical protein